MKNEQLIPNRPRNRNGAEHLSEQALLTCLEQRRNRSRVADDRHAPGFLAGLVREFIAHRYICLQVLRVVVDRNSASP